MSYPPPFPTAGSQPYPPSNVAGYPGYPPTVSGQPWPNPNAAGNVSCAEAILGWVSSEADERLLLGSFGRFVLPLQSGAIGFVADNSFPAQPGECMGRKVERAMWLFSCALQTVYMISLLVG